MNHERHTENVVFRLSPRLRDALVRLAEREETSVSEVVRDALAPRLGEDRESKRYAIGEAVAGGRIDIVYDHDCPAGHVIRGAMHMIPCPYCAVKRAEKAEAMLVALAGEQP